MVSHIESQPRLNAIQGDKIARWGVREVGDGKLNFVYMLEVMSAC